MEAQIEVSPGQSGTSPYHLTVAQVLKMADAGVFAHDDRVELLNGVLVRHMVKGNFHDNSLDTLCVALRLILPAGWLLREDKSLQLNAHSRPEPDIAIVRGPRQPYFRRTPHARETAMVAEVAESTYPYDRGDKWTSYAAARIPIYWIVNLNKRQFEVYTDPKGRGAKAGYRTLELFGEEAEVPVVIDGLEVGRIAVGSILP